MKLKREVVEWVAGYTISGHVTRTVDLLTQKDGSIIIHCSRTLLPSDLVGMSPTEIRKGTASVPVTISRQGRRQIFSFYLTEESGLALRDCLNEHFKGRK